MPPWKCNLNVYFFRATSLAISLYSNSSASFAWMCALTPWRIFFSASPVLDCTIFLSTKQLSEHLKKWRKKAYTRNSFHQQTWHEPDSVVMGSLCCWLLVFWVSFYRASKDERTFPDIWAFSVNDLGTHPRRTASKPRSDHVNHNALVARNNEA